MGDLLFAIANLARKLGVEPESALRQSDDKFTRRFERMEQASRRLGPPDGEMAREASEGSGRRRIASPRTLE